MVYSIFSIAWILFKEKPDNPYFRIGSKFQYGVKYSLSDNIYTYPAQGHNCMLKIFENPRKKNSEPLIFPKLKIYFIQNQGNGIPHTFYELIFLFGEN